MRVRNNGSCMSRCALRGYRNVCIGLLMMRRGGGGAKLRQKVRHEASRMAEGRIIKTQARVRKDSRGKSDYKKNPNQKDGRCSNVEDGEEAKKMKMEGKEKYQKGRKVIEKTFR